MCADREREEALSRIGVDCYSRLHPILAPPWYTPTIFDISLSEHVFESFLQV